MKQVYQTMMAACVLAATGSVNAAADYWSVSISNDPVAADAIAEGTQYILQSSASAKAGTSAYLQGSNFTISTSGINDAGAFLFVKTGEQVNNHDVYYLKNNQGEFVAVPGSSSFYTKQQERAWKVVVLDAEEKNADESYEYAEDGKDPVTYRGIDAYIQRAKNGEEEGLNLQATTFLGIEGQVVIVSATAIKPGDQYSQYQFLLGNTGAPSIGTDYNQNAWVIRPAQKIDNLEALDVAMKEIIPEGTTLEKHFEKYKVGTNAGEYDPAKYKEFTDLWQKATDLVAKKITLSDEEVGKVIEGLAPAYNAFVSAINPLKPGFYIFTNWRGKNEANFDDCAMYDQGAVEYGANGLVWTLRPNDGVDYYEKDELSYNTAKFVWEVIASDQPGKYYFRNLETGRYIGPQPKLTTAVEMTDTPVATFSMGANPQIPDYMTFYSDFLYDYPYYNGLHTQVAGGKTVSWNVYSGGSMWHARTLTEEQVNFLKGLIAQPKRNKELSALVEKAKTAINKGNLYYPLNAEGKKHEEALKGSFDDADGLVTSKDQLTCPMADPDEGKDINAIFDNNLGTFLHTTYHGGEYAWNAHHFFTFSLAEAVNSIVVKWGERPVSNAVNGAPRNVVLWGAKDEAALTKDKVQKKDKDGNPIDGQYDYDAWKKDGWVQLTTGTFDYSTKMLAADGTENGRKVGFVGLGFEEPYKYLRLEFVDKMNGGASGFVYANELRVYKGEFDQAQSPNATIPADVMTELKALIATADAELKAEKATEATIEKFKVAYEKFRANYPDPTRVTELADKVKTRLEKSAEDNEKLGYYEVGAKDELKAAYEKAMADFKAITDQRAASVTDINNTVAQLNAAFTTFESKLRMPSNGLYTIQTESMHKHIYGNLLSVRSSSTTTYDQVCVAGRKASETAAGEYVDTPDRDQHLEYYWHVEKVEGGFTLRNAFNGLYLSRDDKKQQRAMMLSETPYVFKVEFINFPGAFRFVSTDGKEENYPYVNADPSSKTVVTWLSAKENDNSAFSFHPVDQEKLNSIFSDGLVYNLASKTGFQLITLPIDAEFEVEETSGNFYTVIGQNPTTKDVVLKAVSDKKLKAGQAYVFQPGKQNNGTVKLYPTAKSIDELKPTNKAGEPVNGLHATFDFVKIAENNGLISPDRASVVLSEQGDRANANTGYFGKLPETTEKGDLVIPAHQIITLIKTGVLQPSSKTKGTFTLSGVRVDDVNSLPAGIYVINGHKVVVK